MSSQRGNPPTQEPQVENLTRYSPRSRTWSKRGLLGIKSRDFIVEGNTFLPELKQNLTGNQGNDPFDYEQKLPEDKQYEELGPAARVWRTYLEECGLFDREMVEGWKDGLDVLLVFVSASTVHSTSSLTPPRLVFSQPWLRPSLPKRRRACSSIIRRSRRRFCTN